MIWYENIGSIKQSMNTMAVEDKKLQQLDEELRELQTTNREQLMNMDEDSYAENRRYIYQRQADQSSLFITWSDITKINVDYRVQRSGTRKKVKCQVQGVSPNSLKEYRQLHKWRLQGVKLRNQTWKNINSVLKEANIN